MAAADAMAGRIPIGTLLRGWRKRRKLSQLDLALEADVSSRHICFLETGRAHPSREMVLHLADHLEIPHCERNSLLLSAGYAPLYPEPSYDARAVSPTRDSLDRFLRAHEPYPAALLDRRWNLLSTNDAFALLTEGVERELLGPSANALRLILHPRGIASRIINLAESSAYLLQRLRRHLSVTGDAALERLYAELSTYPGVRLEAPHGEAAHGAVGLLLRMQDGDHELAFFCTMSTLVTAPEITFTDLTTIAFYPANANTAGRLLRDVIGSGC